MTKVFIAPGAQEGGTVSQGKFAPFHEVSHSESQRKNRVVLFLTILVISTLVGYTFLQFAIKQLSKDDASDRLYGHWRFYPSGKPAGVAISDRIPNPGNQGLLKGDVVSANDDSSSSSEEEDGFDDSYPSLGSDSDSDSDSEEFDEFGHNPVNSKHVDVMLLFEKFKTTFGKKYATLAEETRRYLVFASQIERIAQWNSEDQEWGTEYGVNEFSDMTDDEFSQMLMPVTSKAERLDRANEAAFIKRLDKMPIEARAEIPKRFDWRTKGVVTPVKAQGKCGSCWAFATAATVESAYAVKYGELRNLSEQELLDCNLENNACNGGDVDKAFRFVHENGLMYEDAYPYVAHRQNTCSIHRNETTKISVAYWLHPSEDAIIDWLLNNGPVNVGIAVPPGMKQYKGGVYTPSPYDCKFRVLGLHALLVVGYDETPEGEKYWIIKNSWGNTYGVENGYVYFARGQNHCGIEDEPLGILA